MQTWTLLPLVWAASGAAAAPPDRRGEVAPDRAFDLEALHLDLRLDPAARAVEGTARYTVRRLSPGPLRLDQVDLEIRAVRVDGAPAAHRVGPGVLEVPLAGAAAVVEVDWRAVPRTGLHFREAGPVDAWSELWSQGEATDNRHWFPGWDAPNDRFAYTGVVQGPPGWRAVTNSGVDLVNYLVAVAAGEYTVHPHAELTDWEIWAGPLAPAAGIAHVQSALPQMRRELEAATGVPWPWGPYRQIFVQRFLYGGMENTGATIIDTQFLAPESTLPTRGLTVHNIVAHELAHQWYGDLLTCRTWRELWLNEGFATFYAAELVGSIHGDAERVAAARGWQQAAVGGAPMARRHFHGDEGPDSHKVYVRGALALHGLRALVGPEAYRAAVVRYTRGNRLGLVETRDLQRAFEDVTGQHLDWYFQQLVEAPHAPVLRGRWSHADGRLTVSLAQSPGAPGEHHTLAVDVDIGLADGSVSRRRVWIDDGEATLEEPLAARPAWVVVDPEHALFATVEQDQSPGEWSAVLRGAPSVGARLRAAEALGRTAESAALVAVAGDGAAPVPVREAAVAALGAQRAASALAPLSADPSDRVRLAAVRALGGAFGPSAAVALEARVRSDRNPEVAAAALRSLAAVDAGAAAALARDRLGARPGQPAALPDAARAVLGKAGAPKDLSRLLDLRVPGRLRIAGLQAAAELVARARREGTAGADALAAQVARAAEGLLNDIDLRSREAAMALLGGLGDEGSVPLLEAAARREAGTGLDADARAALVAIRSRAPAPAATPNALEAQVEDLRRRLEALEKEQARWEDRR